MLRTTTVICTIRVREAELLAFGTDTPRTYLAALAKHVCQNGIRLDAEARICEQAMEGHGCVLDVGQDKTIEYRR